jgi:hypothetical protein
MHSRTTRKSKGTAKKEISLPLVVDFAFALYEKKVHLFFYMIVVVTGVLSITLHFLYNEYFPDLDLIASLTLLLLIAFSSLLLLLILGIALNINPLVWSLFIDTEYCREAIKLMSRAEARNARTTKVSNVSKIAFLFAIPVFILVFLLLIHLTIYIYNQGITGGTAYLMLASAFVCGHLAGVIVYRALRRWHGLSSFGYLGIFVYHLTLFFSLLVSTVTPFLIWVLYKSQYSIQTIAENNIINLVIMIAGTFLVVLSLNTAQLMASLDSSKSSLGKFFIHFKFSGLVLLVVVAMSSNYFLFAQVALKLYGLADVVNIDILFSAKGCEVLRGLEINYVYIETDKNCRLPHATLVSAIGTKNLILAENGRRFTSHKDDSLPDTGVKSTNLTIIIKEFRNENGNLTKVKVNIDGQIRKSFDGEEKNDQFVSAFFYVYNNEGILITPKSSPNALNELKLSSGKLLWTGQDAKQIIKYESPLFEFEEKDNPSWSDVSILIDGIRYSYKLVRKVNYENSLIH